MPDPHHFHVLVVEDNPADADLLAEYLGESHYHWHLTVAERLSRALELLEGRAFGAVLLDLGLPDSQGLETLTRVLEVPVHVPVIVLTGHADSELAWKAVEAGAHDFLSKGEITPSLLERTLRYAVRRGEVEGELREQKDRFQSLLDLSVMGIYMIDADTRFVYANRRFAEILGYAPDELVGKSAVEVTVEEDRDTVETMVRERIEGKRESARYTLRAVKKSGDPVELEVHGRRIEMGGEPMILGALQDVTEKKELERQLMHAQKLEAVGRLAGGVAHDFNNLLTVVSGNTELLSQQLDQADVRREFLQEIKDAADRATGLTRQLLIFSRRDTVQARVVDLHEVIEGLERLLGRLVTEDIRMTRDLAARTPCIRADPGRLEQLLMNLVLNAQDAMPDGGELWIQTTDDPGRAREWDPAVVPDGESEDWLYLRVADSGTGINPEILSQIYDPFFTTKAAHEGTGLGLSTVYGIVTEAGGQISAGQGSLGGAQFTIRLPREAQDATVADGDEDHPTRGAGERIFILEDEESVRSVVRRILERNGYQVLDEGDPEAALERFRKGETVDLFLSDIVMPGMHGPEVYEELRSLNPDLKALFMSGYSEEATIEKVGELESTVLSKPFRPDELLAAVARVLGR